MTWALESPIDEATCVNATFQMWVLIHTSFPSYSKTPRRFWNCTVAPSNRVLRERTEPGAPRIYSYRFKSPIHGHNDIL